MSNDAPFPLTEAAKGQAVRLVRVNGGAGFCHRLAELGLTPGVELTVVQDAGGPLMLCVRDSRIALGRGMAHKMDVELCEDCPVQVNQEILDGEGRSRQGRMRRLLRRGRGQKKHGDKGAE